MNEVDDPVVEDLHGHRRVVRFYEVIRLGEPDDGVYRPGEEDKIPVAEVCIDGIPWWSICVDLNDGFNDVAYAVDVVSAAARGMEAWHSDR